MQLLNNRIIYSASDLTNYLECEHLANLDNEAMYGRLQIPPPSPESELLRRHGQLFEREMYNELGSAGKRVIEVPIEWSHEGLVAAAARTLELMRRGEPFVGQGTFFDDQWLGRADLLRRIEIPSHLGGWSYEAVDAKLARHAKPYFLIQLCFYSDQLARLQGDPPEFMYLRLGSGAEEKYRFRDFAAYYRGIKARFLEHVAHPFSTYPNPVEFCDLCRWNPVCTRKREQDDHLSLIANIQRRQIARLGASGGGITSVASLAAAPDSSRPAGMVFATFDNLRAQARIQVEGRRTGANHHELLEPETGRGFELLPKPSPADLYFDIEGDPYIDGGLEYLFGVTWRDEGSATQFKAFWAHDNAGEKRALEEFVDFVNERRRRFPGLHVYHYANYEPAALKRLMSRHATREDEIDDWLRAGVLVDLFQAVRQSMRISRPGYGLKEVEVFYGRPREDGVATAVESVVAYERWLETKDQKWLTEIEQYNRKDCQSTLALHGWLLERRLEAVDQFGRDIPFKAPPEPRAAEEMQHAERSSAIQRLLDGIPDDPDAQTTDQRARWLLAQLLEYHHREVRPVFWTYYDRCGQTPAELVDDGEAIGDLTLDESVPPRPDRRSYVYTLSFPQQQHKLSALDSVDDPATRKSAGTLLKVDDEDGLIELKRGAKIDVAPVPRALIPGRPPKTLEQQAALRRLAENVVARAENVVARAENVVARIYSRAPADDCYHALWDILTRAFPRIRGRKPGQALQGETVDLEQLKKQVAGLDNSYLFIQGPPGSGKTYTGARLIIHLLKQGKRIGVAANSHKAIQVLLAEVEQVAKAQRFRFRGLKKSGETADSEYASPFPYSMIENQSDYEAFPPADAQLVAGTAWLFSRAKMDGWCDYLFIDEAGQVSLADALAMGTAARNVVLLGDPLQLAQVSQAVHPDGAGASVLEHLLGDQATIPPERGVFLEHTHRMHPDVCRFISEIVYEGRLQSAQGLERQSIASSGLSGAGLRYLRVDHRHRDQDSEEEAAVIAGELEKLLHGTVTEECGATRALTPADVLVVTPYNRQVKKIKDVLRRRGLGGVRVGTVDKFQGQQAPVVFYSMATSSGEDIPRNLEFLFSRNRLNVAISRARCLAVLVACPRLLEIRCINVDQMQMVNALCRLTELAT